ncbi:MAG: Rne/Rng family ribonuclease [Brachyspira sp.]|nr:Rne/Rng family ribonuclease [Brachyspira sp.]
MANNRNFKEQQQGKKIIIAERDNIAAVLENGKVTDFFIHRGDVLLGDVYLATVDNILPSIDAAFVNVGTDKMGFLHAQDVMGKGTLKEKLKPKQKLIVQVVKEPMPYEPGVSVSKKIENSRERARLKAIMNLIKPVGVGVIIRTEAEGQSEADIQEDLEILLEKWNNIITSAETLNPPNLIYRDQDLLYRVIREACTEDTKEIVVDTAFAMSRVQNILQNWHISKNIEVTLYKGTEPLLIAYDIHKEIKAALNVKVNMPSGGYLFIQQTEALTVIDVNSGKFTSSSTQDETILKTNIEAVHEIARQLRLRNIGGMIIVDFIDMMSRADKLAMLEELEIALEPDKAKPQVGQLSDLGLVELTRHRQGQSLSEIFTKKCPHCQGSGCSVIDFNFATPTAEGEYRAKAAKLKLPTNNFKKNNNNNNNKQNNKPQLEETPVEIQEQVPTPEIQVENPSTVAVQEAEKTEKKPRRTRKTRFDKPKTEPVETPLAVTEEVHTAETVLKINEEIKPEIAEEVIEAKFTKQEPVEKTEVSAEPAKEEAPAPEKAAAKQNSEKAETNDEKPAEPVETEVKEEKPKRTRRPNRGTSKRTRTKKTASEEKVETEES